MHIRPIVAVDIGSTKVACAVGNPMEASAGFRLIGSSIVSFPSALERLFEDPLQVSRAIEQALDEAEGSDEAGAAFVIAGHGSLLSESVSASLKLGDEPVLVRAHDIERLERAALEQVLGVDREPLVVERLGCSGNGFDNVYDPRGLSATRLRGNFHIITIPIAVQQAFIRAVESAGLDVEQLSSSLPAILAGAGRRQLYMQHVLIIEERGQCANIGYFARGLLRRSAVVPFGFVTVAGELARSLQVTMEQALVWVLEGTSCSKRAVCEAISKHWRRLEESVMGILAGEPKPETVVISGRGALADGFVEWIERTTGINPSLCRHPLASQFGDFSQQVGLSAAIGLLELAVRSQRRPRAQGSSSHVLNRVISHARTILSEYF